MLMGMFNTSTRIFDGLMYLVVILGGGYFLMQQQILPGDMVAYVMYVSTLIATIRRIIEFAEQFQRGITGIERFIQIMDADVEIFDEPDAKELVNPKGEIVFENVSFEYPDDHNKVFHNLNLTIHAGEKLAIVGPSGGGKTTLCNLIPRFYDVSGGTITLDGNNIRGLTLKSLRQNIGIVQQDVYLFSGTVYEDSGFDSLFDDGGFDNSDGFDSSDLGDDSTDESSGFNDAGAQNKCYQKMHLNIWKRMN